MTRIFAGLVIVFALVFAPSGYGQDVILLDTYQDDVIGDPPNGPEIGSYLSLIGNHQVDDFGGGDLKVLSFSQSGDGYVISMRPIAEPAVAETTYEITIFGNSQLTGANAVNQTWALQPTGNNISLYWGNAQGLWVRLFRGDGTDRLFNTGFSWSFDTEYDVSVITDATTDTFSVRVNGTDVVVNEPHGADFTHIYSMSFSDNLASSVQRVLNDVRMVNKACETESTPPVAELETPPHLGTGCTCADPEIVGTADDPEVGLGSYAVEYRPTSGGAWQTIATGDTSVASGVLGTWSTGSVSEGYYNIRLRVTNACGLSSSDVRTVYLDKAFSSLELRSPESGAIVGRTVCLDGTVFDSWCFEEYAAEYRPAGGGTWQPVDPGMPVYTSTVVNDPFAIWETSGLGIADGDYDLRVMAETECGNMASLMRTVTVDNTAPESILSNISNCDELDGVVEIRGTASDTHLRSWTLQYNGGGATSWTTIASGNTSVVNGVLANWDTSGVPACAYVLRLRVTDDSILNCGSTRHVSDAHVTVNVGSLGDADLDNDGDVDLNDFALFELAFTGPMP